MKTWGILTFTLLSLCATAHAEIIVVSSCYLKVPANLVEKVRAESRRQEREADKGLLKGLPKRGSGERMLPESLAGTSRSTWLFPAENEALGAEAARFAEKQLARGLGPFSAMTSTKPLDTRLSMHISVADKTIAESQPLVLQVKLTNHSADALWVNTEQTMAGFQARIFDSNGKFYWGRITRIEGSFGLVLKEHFREIRPGKSIPLTLTVKAIADFESPQSHVWQNAFPGRFVLSLLYSSDSTSWYDRELEKQEDVPHAWTGSLLSNIIKYEVKKKAADEAPLLTYHWNGGFSPYKYIRVIISPSGLARVTGERLGLPPVDYETQLSNEEVAALHALIRSTEFFSQPDPGTQPDPHIGHADEMAETVLSVHANGKNRTLTYLHRPSLEPLTHPLRKLVAQAFAIQDLVSDGDISTATAVVKPNYAVTKALHPRALKEPLISYIRNHKKRHKVQWALEALAWITTPEEYCGFVSLGVGDPKQKDKFLGIVGTPTFYGNIPDSHVKALCPVYLSFVRDAQPRKSQLNAREKQALSDFTRLLGYTRYQPSIPMFKQWFEDHDKPYITTPLTPLAKMGIHSLNTLIPYLERPEEAYRANAIELITITSRLGPNAGFANPLSSYEYGRMIPVLTQTVIPKLRDLAENDPSAKVREKASEAVEEIEKLIKKEEMSTP